MSMLTIVCSPKGAHWLKPGEEMVSFFSGVS